MTHGIQIEKDGPAFLWSIIRLEDGDITAASLTEFTTRDDAQAAAQAEAQALGIAIDPDETHFEDISL